MLLSIGGWRSRRGAGVGGCLAPSPTNPLTPAGGEGRLGCQFSVCSCESGHAFSFASSRLRVFASSRLRGFAASRLRVRHDADKHWGLVEWPRGRCLGAWPPHPRPLSPCGGEGRLGCQFSVFSCESGHAFSFASSRLRVRHDAAEHWGLAEWPWGRCLGVFGSLTPDPSPPAGARGD